jgi:hypothetical protein
MRRSLIPRCGPSLPIWCGALWFSHEFGKLIGDETEKWANVVKFASIKPE